MGSNYTQRFCDNKKNSNMFPTGTLSFQASHQIRSCDDLSVVLTPLSAFSEK